MPVDHSDMVAKGKVSLAWQCAGAPFWITGIIAFHRIKKLQSGIVMYILTHLGFLGIFLVIMATVSLTQKIEWDQMFEYTHSYALIVGLVAFIVWITIPIYFMRKWCIKWNQGFEIGNVNE